MSFAASFQILSLIICFVISRWAVVVGVECPSPPVECRNAHRQPGRSWPPGTTILLPSLVIIRAAESHSFIADPNPAVFLNADPDPASFQMRIRIQFKNYPEFSAKLLSKFDKNYNSIFFSSSNFSLLDPKMNVDPCGTGFTSQLVVMRICVCGIIIIIIIIIIVYCLLTWLQ